MPALQQLLWEHPYLDHFDLCAALQSLAACPSGPGRLQLAQQLTQRMADTLHPLHGVPLMDCLDARGRSTTLWAWAKLKFWPHPHFMRLLQVFVADSAGGANPRSLSEVAWVLNQAWQAWQAGPRAMPWISGEQQVQDLMQKLQLACLPQLRRMNFQVRGSCHSSIGGGGGARRRGGGARRRGRGKEEGGGRGKWRGWKGGGGRVIMGGGGVGWDGMKGRRGERRVEKDEGGGGQGEGGPGGRGSFAGGDSHGHAHTLSPP